MSYEQRKVDAVEHVDNILADARDDSEMRRDERRVRDAEDRAGTAERDSFDFADDRPAPGFQRALDSATQSGFAQARFYGGGSDELDAAFGSGRADDDGAVVDDDDDYLE